MGGNIRAGRFLVVTPGSVFSDGLGDGSSDTNHNLHAGRFQSLESIRPATSGQDGLNVFLSHELRGLYPRPAGRADMGIFHSLKLHCLGIDDQIVRAAAEPRVDRAL